MLTLHQPQIPHPTRSMSASSAHIYRQQSASSSTRPLSPPRRSAPTSLPVPSRRSSASSSGGAFIRSPSPPRSSIDISTFPSTDLLRVLATLLQRVATTNDNLRSQHQNYSQTPLPPPPASTPTSTIPFYTSLTTASKQSLLTPSSPLSFHARNVPAISIESYLLRILKYCPTTNEVFLSLLVYFDRMATLGDGIRREMLIASGALSPDDPPPPSGNGGGLVIDSYNVHRLIIAGVTVASKFFSDVFYTNSRYAKVGGLPQSELNQLELQFLLLNDFCLVIPLEELQNYADQLMLFSSSVASSNTATSARPASSLSATPSSTLSASSAALHPPSLAPSHPAIRTQPSSVASSHRHHTLTNGIRSDTITAPAPGPTPIQNSDPNTSPTPTPTSSTSTITPSSYANANVEEDYASNYSTTTPNSTDQPVSFSSASTETDGDFYNASEDDPTIRVYQQGAQKTVASSHSHRSSFSTEDGEFTSGVAERDSIPMERDESPAASLRYVNGAWGRGHRSLQEHYGLPASESDDESSQEEDNYKSDDDGDHPETEDEVVYRGRIKGLGPAAFTPSAAATEARSISTPTLGSTPA